MELPPSLASNEQRWSPAWKRSGSRVRTRVRVVEVQELRQRDVIRARLGCMSVIFLSGPIGAGKTAVAQELLRLLPAPLSYIEGDRFWSFINKGGERGLRENFPVLVRSMTAAALPFARSGFRVLI